MNKRVYLLTIVSFVVGMVELIIGGILDLIADDLNVSLGKAGFLITVFSLVFAIVASILLTMTARIERKQLTLISLFVFLIGTVLVIMSTTYTMLLIAGILSAAPLKPRLSWSFRRGGMISSLFLAIPKHLPIRKLRS